MVRYIASCANFTHLICQSGKSYTDESRHLRSTTGALSYTKSKPGIASSLVDIYLAKYRILRMSGEIRRNWFSSNFDRTFLESVKRLLARVLSIDHANSLYFVTKRRKNGTLRIGLISPDLVNFSYTIPARHRDLRQLHAPVMSKLNELHI